MKNHQILLLTYSLALVLLVSCGGSNDPTDANVICRDDDCTVELIYEPESLETIAGSTVDDQQNAIGEMKAEVARRITEDIDALEKVLRLNMVALANVVYRRFDGDFWGILENIRNEFCIENEGATLDFLLAPFNRDAEDFTFDEMMMNGAQRLRWLLSSIDHAERGILHFNTSRVNPDFMGIKDWHVTCCFYGLLYFTPFETGYFPRHDFIHPSSMFFHDETIIPPSHWSLGGTEIIRPGIVAKISLYSALGNLQESRAYLMPFFEYIQDYDDLILDFRLHSGGFAYFFEEVFMRPLIAEAVEIKTHYFASSGGHVTRAYYYDSLRRRSNSVLIKHDAREFINERGMIYFNVEDLHHLSYAVEITEVLEPLENGFPFQGKIWMLISPATSSAGEEAVLFSQSSGFATVVGQNTRGVMYSDFMQVLLPNSGFYVRVDVGYYTDAYGRNLQEHGIAPDYFNRPGLNALQTVLAMIDERQ